MKSALAAAAALVVLSSGQAAQAAGIVTFTVSGTFDTLDPDTSPNSLAALLGTSYTMSLSLGTDASSLIRTEADPSQAEKGWFFNTHSALQTALGQYTQAQTSGGVVAAVTDNYVYNGSAGLLPAGVYDIIDITGWRRGSGPVVDPVACPHPTGGSLLGDSAPGPCSLAGSNTALDLTIIGTSSLINSLSGIPFGGLDLSQVRYIQTNVRAFNNGALVGAISQDPPVTYHDALLTGPGLTATLTAAGVPEPSAWGLMILGLGSAGLMLRRRHATA